LLDAKERERDGWGRIIVRLYVVLEYVLYMHGVVDISNMTTSSSCAQQ